MEKQSVTTRKNCTCFYVYGVIMNKVGIMMMMMVALKSSSITAATTTGVGDPPRSESKNMRWQKGALLIYLEKLLDYLPFFLAVAP